ncbi:MAG: right-handed parallel beta-helix repeat-containing protein, partial [Sphingobacteriales bacterium]
MTSTTIDGSTQPGNTNPLGPEIEIEGSHLDTEGGRNYTGLKIGQNNTTIKSLIINGFYRPIYINANNTRVESCYLGTDYTGTARSAHNARYETGIYLYAGVSTSSFSMGTNNIIGGDTPEKGNVIGFAEENGIYVYSNASYTFRNNAIINNGRSGIYITTQTTYGVINNNVIRGNNGSGIRVLEASMG